MSWCCCEATELVDEKYKKFIANIRLAKKLSDVK